MSRYNGGGIKWLHAVWLTISSFNLVWFRSLSLSWHCGACRRKWRLTDTDLRPCGQTQTTSHIVESCPLTKLNGGLSRLHSADEGTVSWLTSYGSWNAYEKKIELSTSVASAFMVLYTVMFLVTSFSLPFVELSLVKLALDLVVWPLLVGSCNP